MTTRVLPWMVWVLAAALVGTAAARWRAAARVPLMPPMRAYSDPLVVDSAAIGRVEAIARRVAVADPFRIDRRVPDVAFDPAGDATGAVAPAAGAPGPQRPQLLLRGLLGPPWRAVLEGVPGHPGSVLVGKGDTLGGLRVRAVAPDRVVVEGVDTTWKLTLQR